MIVTLEFKKKKTPLITNIHPAPSTNQEITSKLKYLSFKMEFLISASFPLISKCFIFNSYFGSKLNNPHRGERWLIRKIYSADISES